MPEATINNYRDLVIIGIIALIGAGTLWGVFKKMNRGFGPYNLRAVGIVLVGTFAAVLGARDASALAAAMGILGSIAGYLFGVKDGKDDEGSMRQDSRPANRNEPGADP